MSLATNPQEVRTAESPEFKSPLRKLVRCFQKSRDRWKHKYMALKARCKALTNQARALDRSRDHWKQKARLHQRQIRQLQRELEQQKARRTPLPMPPRPDSSAPSRHPRPAISSPS
jgi:hypothetical protein